MRQPALRLRILLVLPLFGFLACAAREAGPGAAAGGAGAPPAATLVLRGGVVRTMDPARPRAEAVAVSGARIVFVGDAAAAGRYVGPATRVVELAGRTVLPAFQDSHVHLATGGVELGLCDLNGLATRDEIFARVREYAAAHPGEAWVVGGGWALPAFPMASPRKEDLDRLVPERPACLSAADGHSVWVNSAALRMAAITAATTDPPGGRIERDARTGEPTGTLRESAADLVEKLVPPVGPGAYREGLLRAQALANRFGITSIIEASASPEILDAYADLDRRGELTVRVLASIEVDPRRPPDEEAARLARLRDAYRTPHLRAAAAKIFADGVLEAHTARLLEPYLDRPGDRGPLDIEPAVFGRLASALAAAGFPLHVHAIGDGAVRETLDAVEEAIRVSGRRDLRHHIAHLELIHPADLPRFKALGVTANVQALWAYPDAYITDLTIPILGPERSARLYPLGGLIRAGARLAGGSDWSVSSLNPLDAIQVGTTRRAPDAGPGPAWLPEEAVPLDVLVAAYTVNGAWLSGEEDDRGRLAPGRLADLIVLDRDPFDVPASDIHGLRVLLTLFEGRPLVSRLMISRHESPYGRDTSGGESKAPPSALR